MKKLLFVAAILLTLSLEAEQEAELPPKLRDQSQYFMTAYFAVTQEALNVCHDNGYKFFKIKKMFSEDSDGQTLDLKGSCLDESGDLIEGSLVNTDFGVPITIQYDIMCYTETSLDELAIDVEEYLKLISQYQDEQEEEEEAAVGEISTLEELENELAHSDSLIFVDCYSLTCPPCRILSPKYDQYAIDLAAKGKFLKANMGEAGDIADSFSIRGLPTLLIFDKGELQTSLIGLQNICAYFEALYE